MLRPKYKKSLEKNIKGMLPDIGQMLFYYNPKSKATNKNRQRNHIKLKAFCTAEEMIKTLKRQPVEWVKIFENALSNK